MARLSDFLWPYLSLVGSVFALTIVFYILEELFPAESQQPASGRLFNTAYYIFLVLWLLVLQIVFAPVFSFALIKAGGGLLPRFMSAPRGVLAQIGFALAFAFVWDLWQYWVHRLQHAWPLFWETHKFHHSETALNATAQARHHMLHYVLNTALYLPLVLFWGGLTPHFLATFMMFRLWGFVNHANARLNLGFLTPVVAGPQWHRIHHSIIPEHFDKNFATFFPFIDILFGTYYRPRKDEHPPTGLPARDYSSNLSEATVAPFINLYKFAVIRTRKMPAPVSERRPR